MQIIKYIIKLLFSIGIIIGVFFLLFLGMAKQSEFTGRHGLIDNRDTCIIISSTITSYSISYRDKVGVYHSEEIHKNLIKIID